MKKLYILIALILPLIGFGQIFDALSNPKISVDIEHPPGLGLKIDKVVFNPTTGNCSNQIIDGLITDFISNNVEVIDRANLQTIVSEQNFNLSGYVEHNIFCDSYTSTYSIGANLLLNILTTKSLH